MSSTESLPSTPSAPAEPAVDGDWLRPRPDAPAEPRWGHPDGIQLGLHPLEGPRGLLRIYAPYLEHPRDRLLNFIAIEPIVVENIERGYSELEPSTLDGVQGKRFWSADSLHDTSPQDPSHPARGIIDTVDGVERLTLFVISERFDNGAHVAVRVRFRADRPHELSLASIRLPDSTDLDYCVLTATMGNFARLRRVELIDRSVSPTALWPDFEGEHFTEHAAFGLAELRRNPAGEVELQATTDEADPVSAVYADDVAEHWKYVGRRAVQTWIAADPDPSLHMLVNARRVYWASTSPIPGGTSFENFELKEPFRQERELRFRVDPA